MADAFLFLGDFFYDNSSIPLDLMQIADYIKQRGYKVILNLEAPITSRGSPITKRGPNLRQSPEVILALKALSVVGVCLANNHIMDFGEEGLDDTLKILDANGIAHTGAGINIEAALEPMTFKINDRTLAVRAFGWGIEETRVASKWKGGCAPRKQRLILSLNQNQRTKTKGIINAAVMHWGFEFNKLPLPMDVQLARAMIDFGYDLVIGHHPHVSQPVEIYRDRHIYYSLGNFYFSSRRNSFLVKDSRGYICDLGLGVVFSSPPNKPIALSVDYHRDKEETCLRELLPETLPLLSGVKPRSAEYRKGWKRQRNNKNPILYGSLERDLFGAIWLLIWYGLGLAFRVVRGLPAIDSLFLYIKKQILRR